MEGGSPGRVATATSRVRARSRGIQADPVIPVWAMSGSGSKLRDDLLFGAGALAVVLLPIELLLWLFAPLPDPFGDRVQQGYG